MENSVIPRYYKKRGRKRENKPQEAVKNFHHIFRVSILTDTNASFHAR